MNTDSIRKRKGVTFVVVIGILTVLLIAIISYNSMLRSERVLMYHMIYGDNALIIAECAMEVLQKVVEYEFAKTGYERKDTYFKYEDLIKPKGEFDTVSFDSAKLTALISNSEPVKEIVDIFGGPGIARVSKVEVVIDKKTVRFYEDVCPQSPDIKHNPREKFGILTYRVEVEYYTLKKTLTVAKQIRIINILPKALRFFSFFVKNIPDGTDLNTLSNDKNGKIVSGKALVFNNGDYNRESSPTNCGAIFLGNNPASKQLTLRLSHGADKAGVGEQFQLFEGFYLNDEYKKENPTSILHIGHLEWGFCKDIENEKKFGIQNPNEAKTSMLKLYGTPDNPTPTRVLGNVYRCYLRLAAYQDNNTNGREYMSEIPFLIPGDFTNNGIKPIAEKDENPIGVHSGEWIAKKLFGNDFASLSGIDLYRKYAHYMNQPIDFEPYNYGMCLPIKDKNGMECQTAGITDFNQKMFPGNSNSFGGQPPKPVDEEYTGGDMRKMTIDDNYVVPYASYKFKDDSELPRFREMFVEKNGSVDLLRLGLIAEFEEGVTLPKMTVEKGGMIVCKKGDIRISGDITCDPVQNQTLAIVALDGNIVVDASKVEAILISMKDGAKFTPSKPIQLGGTLAVNSLDFSKLSTTGGNIDFNTAQSSPLSSPHFYYASIQPDVRNWKVSDK